ncbi:hypothetical protein CLG96_16445 [Sphingomonas oleivorans]|uniref:Energy transducer TonB n=1 Tax=Sphingomonas oleivorans TaxID=1735121 RepID=A0A2T5FTY5_9SPHN|nr:hypothetical protein [Sphingomonas oleivorans]PTQ07745.1 hypothetical protein CLG96_16445 [Sphingomonas oleivorans]
MRLVSSQPWSDPRDAPARRRAATLALVVAVHVLMLIMLLRLAPSPAPPPPAPRAPITFEIMPEARVAPARTRAAKARRAQGGAARRAAVPSLAPVPPVAPPMPTSSAIWSQVIPITSEQFAAADIARMPSRPAAQDGEGTGESGTAAGQGSGDTDGPGEGPNGEPLYNAQWYRQPTRAELDAYLPPGTAQSGWGMIACQTVPDYRVENCREIAQSPAGSGLARAVRQAAWQFRVLPPRAGGKTLVGAWVRIRIDYTISRPE